MGCGQSSLKGEKQEDIQEPAKPLKKVGTNFSTVDYDAAPTSSRRKSAVAPDTIHEHKPSEALSPLTERKQDPLTIDSAATPAASTQPETTTTAGSTAFENKLPTQTPQNPVGEDVSKVEPYRDVTASPTSPTNVESALPETLHTDKPAQ